MGQLGAMLRTWNSCGSCMSNGLPCSSCSASTQLGRMHMATIVVRRPSSIMQKHQAPSGKNLDLTKHRWERCKLHLVISRIEGFLHSLY